MTYHEVHHLSRQGFSIRWISQYLGLNWRTVKRLLSIADDRQYERYLESCWEKERILGAYEDFVRSRLQQYPDTSAAQLHDWLKEHYADFPAVTSRTVYNFVQWVRQRYNLPLRPDSRACELVEETPYGAQAQVDFGVYSLRTSRGERVKVFFFTMVLSRSRYKYVYFSRVPFTAQSAADAHELAFAFMGGITDTVVYDQDRVFMVDENHGDLLLTETFRSYATLRGFKLHFCRKADPQSKGKVESVVKYVKRNFLYNRTFSDIDLLNAEAVAWLHRTANDLPHSFTQKRPVQQWETEKPFLRSFHPLNLPVPQAVAYTVRKDNSISYKGNLYSLPYQTYQGRGTKVLLAVRDNQLVVCDQKHKEICRHTLIAGVGQKVINHDHRRDKNRGIAELQERFCTMTPEPAIARELIELIRQDKPRYVRDQLLLLIQTAEAASTEVVREALLFCQQKRIAGAADFKALIDHFSRAGKQPDFVAVLSINPLNSQLPDQALIQPLTSSINDYNLF